MGWGHHQCKIISGVIAVSLLLLGGCAKYRDIPPGTITEITSSVVEREVVRIPSPEPEAKPSADYVIGPNDVLSINVNGKPEFTVFVANIPGRLQASRGDSFSNVQGSRVDGSGNVHLPIVGAVPVAGLTVAQAQARIKEALRTYLKEPWVVVEIAGYRSHPLYLLGQFKAPGTVYMEEPLNLIQGIALGNGFDPLADLRGARLIRDKKIVAVDIYDLLTRGDSAQNIWLRSGDTIYIPDNKSQLVFVFGSVKKPGPIPVPAGGLDLAQAIAVADLRDTGYDFTHVRIIRSLSPSRGELLVVDLDRILRGKALPFPLMAGDIVYVPRNNFGAWNDVIADILPSLQAIGAILQPFVNIKYLQNGRI